MRQVIIIAFISFFPILVFGQRTEELIEFLKGIQDLNLSSQKSIKNVKDLKGPYSIFGGLDLSKAKGIKAEIKNKYLPNGQKLATIYLDYLPNKIYSKKVIFHYKSIDELNSDFFQTSEKLKWTYLHWWEMKGFETSDMSKDTTTKTQIVTFTPEELDRINHVKGYVIWGNEFEPKKYYLEIDKWLGEKQISITIIDFRGIKK